MTEPAAQPERAAASTASPAQYSDASQSIIFYSPEWIELTGPNYNEGFGTWARRGISVGLDENAIFDRWRRLEKATQKQPIDDRVLSEEFQSVKVDVRRTQDAAQHSGQQTTQPRPVAGPSQQPAQTQDSPNEPYVNESIHDYIRRRLVAGDYEADIRNTWTTTLQEREGRDYTISNTSWRQSYRYAAHSLGFLKLPLPERPTTAPLPVRLPVQEGETIQEYCLRAILTGARKDDIRARWESSHGPLKNASWTQYYSRAIAEASQM